MKKKLKIRSVIAGRVFEREISTLSRITSNETTTFLGGITLRHLYLLVEMGKLHPIKRHGRLFFRFKDVEKYQRERREVKKNYESRRSN